MAGLYDAFADKSDLTQAHMVTAIQETYPLATTMREEISRLRAWSRLRTRRASGGPAPELSA